VSEKADSNLFDPEELIPKDRKSFSLLELAHLLSVSTQHLYNLILEKELHVPQKDIDAALSRARIRVSRENVVDFVRRRSSPEFVMGKRKPAKARRAAESKGTGRGKV
jgi:hypothetical protein